MGERLKNLLVDTKKYFLLGSSFMIIGILFGYLFPGTVHDIAQEMIAKIRELASKIEESKSGSVAFGVIFLNNTVSAVVMMVLGLFFSIFPIYGLVVNGVLLGYLLVTMGEKGVDPFKLFAFGILPHGIFELPAIVFAASLGIRYGVLSSRSLLLVWKHDNRSILKAEWIGAIKQFPLVTAVVIVMLFCAALVESFITPAIIETMLGTMNKP